MKDPRRQCGCADGEVGCPCEDGWSFAGGRWIDPLPSKKKGVAESAVRK